MNIGAVMTTFNYDDRKFSALGDTHTGEVDGSTVFHYHQSGNLVWAEYSGGAIRRGSLIAVADEVGALDMRYSHVNTRDELKTGVCQSTPERLPDGRIRLHESWRWTCDDGASGHSCIEEITDHDYNSTAQ